MQSQIFYIVETVIAHEAYFDRDRLLQIFIHHLQAGENAVAGGGILREDDVPRLLAPQ